MRPEKIEAHFAETHYTALEARKKLGLTDDAFQGWVKAGKVKKVVLPGRKHGMYPKRDIDAMAMALQMMLEVQSEKIEFSRSTPGDQVEEMDIGIRCFGREYITPLPERIGFQQKNEHTFWSLKVSGRVVGYVSMFRFPPQFLDDILTGRRIEKEITVKEVMKFSQVKPFDIYIDVMAMDPNLEPARRKYYAGIIISRFVDAILNLLGNKFKIRKIYTVTATQEGDHMVQHLGFKLMPGKSEVPGRTAYIYDLEEDGIERLKALSRRHLA